MVIIEFFKKLVVNIKLLSLFGTGLAAINQRRKNIMKKSILFIILLFAAGYAFSQAMDNNEELNRKERKERELNQKYRVAKYLVENKTFIIEANYLIDNSG
jgi:Tfp pilus assembly protein PilO